MSTIVCKETRISIAATHTSYAQEDGRMMWMSPETWEEVWLENIREDKTIQAEFALNQIDRCCLCEWEQWRQTGELTLWRNSLCQLLILDCTCKKKLVSALLPHPPRILKMMQWWHLLLWYNLWHMEDLEDMYPQELIMFWRQAVAIREHSRTGCHTDLASLEIARPGLCEQV